MITHSWHGAPITTWLGCRRLLVQSQSIMGLAFRIQALPPARGADHGPGLPVAPGDIRWLCGGYP